MNFIQNFSNLTKELENDLKKINGYNDHSKFREVTIIREKAQSYQKIIRPLLNDHKNEHLISDVKKFHEELKIIKEMCNKQIDNILGDVI